MSSDIRLHRCFSNSTAACKPGGNWFIGIQQANNFSPLAIDQCSTCYILMDCRNALEECVNALEESEVKHVRLVRWCKESKGQLSPMS